MNAPTNIQIINGPDGKPAFVVIPYDEYKKSRAEGTIPHEVVSATVDGATPVRAWREYLRLTQAEVAERLGIAVVLREARSQRFAASVLYREDRGRAGNYVRAAGLLTPLQRVAFGCRAQRPAA